MNRHTYITWLDSCFVALILAALDHVVQFSCFILIHGQSWAGVLKGQKLADDCIISLFSLQPTFPHLVSHKISF